MLEVVVKDYANYLKLDSSSGFEIVQDVIDSMLTRLEELSSVIQMIKLKNSECSSSVTEDINKYRSEITMLSKKIEAVYKVTLKVHSNVDMLEKQVEKAEMDFGVLNENKIKSFFKPFLKKNKDAVTLNNVTMTPPVKIKFESVLETFENNENI